MQPLEKGKEGKKKNKEREKWRKRERERKIGVMLWFVREKGSSEKRRVTREESAWRN